MQPEQIKKLRLELGRTQDGMAAIIGVSVITWGRWERGASAPLPVFQTKLKKLWEYAFGKEEVKR